MTDNETLTKHEKIKIFLWGMVAIIGILNVLYLQDTMKLQSEVVGSANTMKLVCETQVENLRNDFNIGDTASTIPDTAYIIFANPVDPKARSQQS